MNITYHGLNCFKIQGKSISLLLDPYEDPKIGLKPPSLKADIVCLNSRCQQITKIKPDKEKIFLISNPGEYEIGGIFIYSFFYPDQQNLIYHLQIDGIKIAHLGNLNKSLDDWAVEKLNGVDILMVPVGGNEVLEAKKSLEIINQIDPRIVIPMHYKISGLNLKLDSIDNFCKEMGIKNDQATDKLKISKNDLPATELKTIIINKI